MRILPFAYLIKNKFIHLGCFLGLFSKPLI